MNATHQLIQNFRELIMTGICITRNRTLSFSSFYDTPCEDVAISEEITDNNDIFIIRNSGLYEVNLSLLNIPAGGYVRLIKRTIERISRQPIYVMGRHEPAGFFPDEVSYNESPMFQSVSLQDNGAININFNGTFNSGDTFYFDTNFYIEGELNGRVEARRLSAIHRTMFDRNSLPKETEKIESIESLKDRIDALEEENRKLLFLLGEN